MPHSEFAGGGFYEFVPALSHGSETGVPKPEARAELTTVDLVPGSADAFENAVRAAASSFRGETLWYRMIAGGPSPRYVRLRPRANFAALLEAPGESALPAEAARLAARLTVEILTLRPTLSYGVTPVK
jgi:hypothetical protein